MGRTSKPTYLYVDQGVLDAAPEQWELLKQQGHEIRPLICDGPHIFVGPQCMRITVAMVRDLPKSIELLIKGARALQYSPQGGDGWQKGKPKRVANTSKGKRKNSKKQVENNDGTEPAVDEQTGRVESEGVQSASETSHIEGNGQDTGR